ncbi:Zinc-binding dehydrogenase [Ceratobasidium sp. AG-Ba]|nr:Zinc-binding dehydrogenase [Ceratobasidium sp. AG-Ba]
MSGTQKAAFLLKEHGDVEVGTRSIPSPGSGEVLVKVNAAAINPVDWKVKGVLSFLLSGYPAVLGSDGAGVVETVGPDVAELKKGDRVFFQGRYIPDWATFQQYALADSQLLAKIPDNISDDEASTIPVAILAAGFTLFQKSGIQFPLNGPTATGKPVLILGGSSSVGQYTIQLARIAGFSPIVTTASAKHSAYLKGLGATDVVDRNADAKTIQAALKGPVSLVVDTISLHETQSVAFEVLHTQKPVPGAHLALVLPLQEDLKTKNESLGSNSVSANEVLAISHLDRDIAVPLWRGIGKWIKDGRLVPNRVQVVPGGVAGVTEALRLSEEGVSGVKLVIHPQE